MPLSSTASITLIININTEKLINYLNTAALFRDFEYYGVPLSMNV